jgi:hypothetical protein
MPPPPVTQETAGPSRQHLKTPTREYGAYNFGRIAPGSIYGGSTPSRQSQDREDVTSKLDSHDLSGIDLNLEHFEIPAPPMDDIEVARRNSTPRSIDRMSGFGGRGSKSLEPDFQEDPLPPDFSLDLDVPLPDLQDQRDRRESKSVPQSLIDMSPMI